MVKRDLEKSVSPKGCVSNIDTVFMLRQTAHLSEKEFVDTVYYEILKSGIDFELLSLDLRLFVGSRIHAEALQETLGGVIENTGYSHIAEWLWRPDDNVKLPLNDEVTLTALFNIVL